MSAEPPDSGQDETQLQQRRASSLTTTRMCELCVELLPVDGAAVAVMGSRDSRELVHSTNTVARQLDELQFVLGEGPCVEAFETREAVLVPDLSAPDAMSRWPVFCAEATVAGALAAFAFPLQAGPVRFGVLELYRGTPGDLDDSSLTTALLIVESAVHVVLSDVTGELALLDDGRPRQSERSDIHRATGMVAAQLGVPIAEALSRLRAASFAQQKPLLVIAREVLDRSRTLPRDPRP